MMNVAFIPVRGGSKSIPFKNIREIAGKPLVYWVTKAANECKEIDKVYVATDSERIREVVDNFKMGKVDVIGRSKESASDTASTETAMVEFAKKYEFDNIVLIQATSPLLTWEDLSGGFQEFNTHGTDSVLSVVRQKRFQWEMNANNFVNPVNYDVFCRPRRQDFDGFLVENGAFYITSRRNLLKSRSRISGNIKAYEMNDSTYFEIDEPNDWMIIENCLKERCSNWDKNHFEIPDIKMFLTDCDGCLTDGGMYYSEKGDEFKKFNTLDGMGFKRLKENGIITGIITGESMDLNLRRSKKLNADIYESAIINKLSVVKQLCQKYEISLKNVAYVGDDINDLEVIRNVGFGCSVANGVKEVKDAAQYVTNKVGGQGAIREVVELILEQQSKLKGEKNGAVG